VFHEVGLADRFVPCVTRRSASGVLYVLMIQKCVHFIKNKFSFLSSLMIATLLMAVFNEFLEPESCLTMTTPSDIRTPHPAVAAPFRTCHSHILTVKIPCIHETQMLVTIYK
jgi:hypothetical protein